MSNMVTVADDYFHVAENDLDWRESYYFNFVSHDHRTAGFTTIGVLPNRKKAEFVLFLICEGKPITYFREIELPASDQPPGLMSDNALTYTLLEPMQRWKVDFSGEKLELRITWVSRFPFYDFGRGSGTSWKGHFEQSGVIKGEAVLPNDRRIRIEGYGQRDKSWGPRNWHIEKWFAFHAQFEAYAIGLRRDTANGAVHVSGGISSNNGQIPASQVEFEMIYDSGDERNPSGAVTTIKYANGDSINLRSRLVSPGSFVKFRREFPSGSTELFEGMAIHECSDTGEKGTGLIEFLTTYPKR